LIFNRVLVLTAQSRLEEALALLKTLPSICVKELKESETEQVEIDKEVGKIQLQTGVVYQLMNKKENAAEIYDSIASDSAIVNAILANNRGLLRRIKTLAVLNGPTRHIDSMLKLRIASASGLDSKLLGFQTRVIACNNAILLSNMKRYGASTCAAKALDGDVSVLIQAGNSLKQKKNAAAYLKLKEYFAENPGSIGVCLAMAQKYVAGGEFAEAIRVVEAYVNVSGARSGIVSLLVWLHHKAGDVGSATRVLSKSNMVRGSLFNT
jgi:predicted Zn-dependent protease